MRPLELTGQVFGRLTVIRRAEKPPLAPALTFWLCRCQCGKEKVISGHSLRNKYTRSCGCLLGDVNRQLRQTHGGRKSSEYISWTQMIDRCENPNCRKFSDYGGRGITISPLWRHDFARFLADMGRRPHRHSLDRINNDGNYSPDNCRWSSFKEQASNRRSNIWIEWNGERLTQSGWAKRLDVSPNTIMKRWKRHGSLVDPYPPTRQPNS